MVAQGAVHIGQLGLGVIRLDPADPFVIFDLSPEVVRVGLGSVTALIDS